MVGSGNWGSDSPRLAVVTGISSAMGRALAGRLRRQGWEVVGLTRTPQNLPPEPGLVVLPADLADPERAADQLSAWLEAERPGHPVGALAHLAGVVFADNATGTTAFEWRHTFTVNVEAGFMVARRLLPRMPSGAAIVMVSSVDAYSQARSGPAAAYGSSKAALHGLVRQLAQEWGPCGIRVNAVAPGALDHGAGVVDGEAGETAPGVVEPLVRDIALGRLGRAEDVAGAVAWLLSDDAGYITGQVLRVDGGLGLGYG